MALFNELRQASFDEIWPIPSGVLQELRELMADDFLEGAADQVSETAVGGSNFSIESHCNQHIVKRIDQISIALLGPLNDREQFIELLIAGRRSVALLDAANQAAQFRHLVISLPDVHDKECDKQYKNRSRHKQIVESPRKRADGVPGNRDISNRKNAQKKVPN